MKNNNDTIFISNKDIINTTKEIRNIKDRATKLIQKMNSLESIYNKEDNDRITFLELNNNTDKIKNDMLLMRNQINRLFIKVNSDKMK